MTTPSPVVTKLASFVLMTDEALADAHVVSAQVSYVLSGESGKPLTLRERVTRRRIYVARDGYRLVLMVGWRLRADNDDC